MKKESKFKSVMLKEELYNLLEKRRADLGLRSLAGTIDYLVKKTPI